MNDALQGLVFLENVESPYTNSRDFQRLLSVYKQNYAVSVHNEAVSLINKGNIEEAKSLIEKGLKSVPGECCPSGRSSENRADELIFQISKLLLRKGQEIPKIK